ncbi:MAG: hypothetical protein ABSB84_13280 [Verrucomicrobiota bacterium]|jgi:hypothetical protein
MANFITNTILKYASKIALNPNIAAPLLRRYYTEGRLNQFLFLDIPSSGIGLQYISYSQEGSCWLNVCNLSPFDFTMDRILIEAVIDGGASFSCTNLMPIGPCVLKGQTINKIYVQGKSPMQPEMVKSAKGGKRARVNITAYIVTSIRSFNISRQIGDLKNFEVI